MEIERLKNCPNCGGLLNYIGKCEYCGSKVYDLFDIDMVSAGQKYIRVKINNGLIIAPVIFRDLEITHSLDAIPTVNMTLAITGTEYYIKEAENDES